jgi:hypothetical protein
VIAGSIVAALLPLLRLSFFLEMDLPSSWLLEWIDTGVDVAILVGFATLFHKTLVQRRHIKVLDEFSQCAAFASESEMRAGSGGNSRLTSRSAPTLYSAIPFASNAPGPTIRV